MTKINFSHLEKMKPEEREYAEKAVDAFIQKIGHAVKDIDTFDVTLAENRRRFGVFGVSEININLVSSAGVFNSKASDWSKTKALKQALQKLEKQIRKVS